MISNRVIIIGAGGIGGFLLHSLMGFVAMTLPDMWTVIIIDGDTFEERNLERQPNFRGGNKAEERFLTYRRMYEGARVRVEAIPKFVATDPADRDPGRVQLSEVLHDGDVVMLCVDNHATRRAVAEACGTLADVTLISGGNNLDNGNVQVVMRCGGEYMTPLLTTYHPEIANPTDLPPWEAEDVPDCMQAAIGNQQIGFVNQFIAVAMGLMFRLVVDPEMDRAVIPSEIALDAFHLHNGRALGPAIQCTRFNHLPQTV